MNSTRAEDVIAQELKVLLDKSTPYSLSTPQLGNPTIHDFVKGLILSTNIIEVIDIHLPNGYRADWAQVIDVQNGNTLSKECDIVIYKGKPFKEIKNQSIKFVLVDRKQAKIVIQVRSSIQSVKQEDKTYCQELRKFVPEVWYIAECCWAKSKPRVNKIELELLKVGYSQFFYFYRMDDASLERTIDYAPFIKLIGLIKTIR